MKSGPPLAATRCAMSREPMRVTLSLNPLSASHLVTRTSLKNGSTSSAITPVKSTVCVARIPGRLSAGDWPFANCSFCVDLSAQNTEPPKSASRATVMSVFTVRFMLVSRVECLKITTDYVPNVRLVLAKLKPVETPAIRRNSSHGARNSDNLQRIIWPIPKPIS